MTPNVLEGRKVWGTMSKLWKTMISRNLKKELYEKLLILTIIYDSEAWSLRAQERGKI